MKRRTVVLVAVISAILTSLLTVQAAGVDVFGAIARWTTELFSFGKTEESRGLVVDGKWPEIDLEQNQQFTSLQEALDYYGVTEVVAPRWLPSGFTQEEVTVDPNGVWLAFSVAYANEDGEFLVVYYSSYERTSTGTLPITLCVEDLMPILNVGRNTAYRLVRSGEIRSIKVGRQIRIPRQFLIDFLNQK